MFNLEEEIQKVFIKNRREKNGFQYTVPSSDTYPYQWLWDSCFHAIILSHFDIESAKMEIRSLISWQFENGLLPHIIYWDSSDVLNIDWGVKGTSSITQPPLLAYAVQNIYKKDNDKKFLHEVYPALDAYYRHLLTRDSRNHHLVGIINPDESGEDNSPRFDLALKLSSQQTFEENNERRFSLFEQNRKCNFDATKCTRNFFWVKDVAYSSYMIENLECLSEIASILENEEDSVYFSEQANSMKNAMKEFMYQDGIYWTIYEVNHKKVMVKTWALFVPMVVGIVSKEDANNLVTNYLCNKDEFLSEYPIPTTAMSEEGFNLDVSCTLPTWLQPNWRGPVWMASNWFVYRGLRRYGFNEQAEEIKEKSLLLLKMSGFCEYYHPHTGEGMGAQDFTWGGLVLDMINN